ncbi:MAG TPA: hypothetical protein VH951_07445 [Dehalococcoidia bacterium]|jgi:hypothetical protein
MPDRDNLYQIPCQAIHHEVTFDDQLPDVSAIASRDEAAGVRERLKLVDRFDDGSYQA